MINEISLLSSSVYISSFLSNLTSSFADSEFVIALHHRLTIGIVLWFISMTAMIMAFHRLYSYL